MNKHLYKNDELQFKTKNECLLTCCIYFLTYEVVMKNIGRNQDGSYIYYITRFVICSLEQELQKWVS